MSGIERTIKNLNQLVNNLDEEKILLRELPIEKRMSLIEDRVSELEKLFANIIKNIMEE